MSQEIELKLELSAEAALDLLGSDVLGADPRILQLRTRYFDTPDRLLSRGGFTLRIRENGHERIQTVKAAGMAAAGLFARPEWERPVMDERPLLDDTNPLTAMLGERVRDITPVFAVEVERRVWTIEGDGATIEAVLDRGQVAAGERKADISELELEVKQGEAKALFSLAHRLAKHTQLRLGVMSKAERGFRLLSPIEYAFKSEAIELKEQHSAAEAFRRIAASCIRQFRLNEPFVEERMPAALHQARVSLRRLRSAFSIFAAKLSGDDFTAFREDTKWLANMLGEARDLDVMLSGEPTTKAPRSQLEQAREEAYDQAINAMTSSRARHLMLDLSHWLALGEWMQTSDCEGLCAEPARDFASAALDRLRRKVKKRGRELMEISDEQRHSLRKDAKKLRYATEFFVSLYTGKKGKRRARKFLAALMALQDRLGALNDLATAQARNTLVPSVNEAAGADAVLETRKVLLAKAADAFDDFVDTKPFWR